MAEGRLARNTALLYARMVVVLIVSLYTTRLVLANLGVEDYGIYNVVGSVVSMFYFLQTAISSANYRYMAYAIGKNDIQLLKTTFKSALVLSVLISIIVIILGESLGLLYIFNYLKVPEARFDAAVITFHISLLTCVAVTIYMPFYSNVISHERMEFFAYLSIVEVFCKLGIAFGIAHAPIDRMVFYAVLLMLMQIMILTAYIIYCKKKFKEFNYIRETRIDRQLTLKMASFSGWTLFVAAADLLVVNGLNILINYFFTPVVNAARGIAVQVQGAVDGFRANLQTALNPQITKRYASNNKDGMFYLMACSARFSTYVLLGVSFPIVFNANYILSVWLKEVPDYTAIFIIMTLISCVIDGISNPYVTAIGATGNVKKFQIWVGITKFLSLPLCYVVAVLTKSPVLIFAAFVVGTVMAVIVRIAICSRAVNMNVSYIGENIFCPIIIVSISGVITYFLLYIIMKPETIVSLSLYVTLGTIVYAFICYFLGLKDTERMKVMGYIGKFLHR